MCALTEMSLPSAYIVSNHYLAVAGPPWRLGMCSLSPRVVFVCRRFRRLRPTQSVRHTFIDGSVDVACSVFALNVLGCHPLSRAVYDVVIIGLITELHAG